MTINGPGNGGGGGGASLGTIALGSITGAVAATATKAITVTTGTLIGNVALTVSGIPAGGQMTLALLQDGTGGRTLTVNGSSVTINQGPASLTTILVDYDGTNTYVTALNIGVQSVAGKTGVVTLVASDVGASSASQSVAAQSAFAPSLANTLFNGFKATGLANGTAATDAATFGQIVAQVADSGAAGVALIATAPQTFFTWTAPNDGALHTLFVVTDLLPGASLTGGNVALEIGGTALSPNVYSPSALGVAHHIAVNAIPVQPGAVITMVQTTNVTGGNGVLYFKAWAN